MRLTEISVKLDGHFDSQYEKDKSDRSANYPESAQCAPCHDITVRIESTILDFVTIWIQFYMEFSNYNAPILEKDFISTVKLLEVNVSYISVPTNITLNVDVYRYIIGRSSIGTLPIVGI